MFKEFITACRLEEQGGSERYAATNAVVHREHTLLSTERMPIPVIYLALMPVALFLSVLAEFAAIMAANALPDWVVGRWMGIPLNLIPATFAGYFVYRVPAEHAHASARDGDPHLFRSAPLYAGIALVSVWIVDGIRSPGFGLIAQLGMWPFGAFLGGVFADLQAGRDAVHEPAA